ncbi:MAG: sulfite exporter TauE/SafE family protein [Pseudomonadota bacterium]
MFGVDNTLLLSVFGIFLFAGTVKGILGFGLPIITMSLLPFVMPIEKAIALSAIVQPATNIFQLVSAGGYKQSFKLAWPVLLMLVPGVAMGAWYLTELESETLLLLVGITIVAFSLFDLLGYKVSISEARKVPFGMGFGLVAGIFGALTALNGWAFIMYLIGVGASREVFRSAIAMLFLVSGFLISSSFWVLGWLTTETVLLGVLALLTAFPGMTIGNRLGRKLSGETFRKMLLIALVIVGLTLAVQAGS